MGLTDYSVKEASSISLGQSGRLTITDTNPHYGLYVGLTVIKSAVFSALTDEGSTLANGFAYTSGGTTEVEPGMLILGNTSGAQAHVEEVTLSSGSWAAGTAAGWIRATPVNAIAFSASETVAVIKTYANGGSYQTVVSNAMTTESAANGGTTANGTQTGVTYPAGISIFGRFTKITLSSGVVEAYRG